MDAIDDYLDTSITPIQKQWINKKKFQNSKKKPQKKPFFLEWLFYIIYLIARF